jgi:uncharacterized RDD family membrane protein YckC
MEQESINPYAAPQTLAASPELAAAAGTPNARLGKRFLHLLIDFVAVMGLLFVLFIILAVLKEMELIRGRVPVLESSGEFEELIFANSAMLIYYTFCEWLFGRSFGKLLTGTKVVTVSGAPLTFLKVLRRSFIRLLPFEAFSFLGSGFGNDVGRGWHDKWTDTRVVDLRAAPVVKPRPMSAVQMPRM